MSAVLKTSVEVLHSGSAVRLLDHATNRFMELSTQEGGLLALHDGTTTMAQLAERARATGLQMDADQAAAILERVRAAGFLSEKAGPLPLATLPPLLATDPVPLFRGDLVVQKKEGAKGLLEVVDPQRSKAFSLYDFEVSIARMMNGQRNAGDVIQAAGRLGISVTLDSLRKFIRQLSAYHFLAEATPTVSDAEADRRTWKPRQPWTPEIREFFQSSLRLFRAGRMEDAQSHLDALLELDPHNTEALELKRRVALARNDGSVLAMLFDDLHGDYFAGEGAQPLESASPGGNPSESIAAASALPDVDSPQEEEREASQQRNEAAFLNDDWVTSQVAPDAAAAAPPPGESTPFAVPAPPALRTPPPAAALPPEDDLPMVDADNVEEPALADAPGETAPEPQPTETPADPGEPVPRRPNRARMLWAGGAAAVAGVLLFPVTESYRINCELSPLVVAEVTSPRSGRLVLWAAKNGATVTKGEVVARLGAEALEQEVGEVAQQRAALEGKVAELTAQVSRVAQRAAANVVRAEVELKRRTTWMEQLDASVAQAPRARAAVARATAEQAQRQAALDAARSNKAAKAGLQKELDVATAARRKAEEWVARTARSRRQLNVAARDVTKQRAVVEQARSTLARVSRKAEVDERLAQLQAIRERALLLDKNLAQSAIQAPVAGAFRAQQPVGTEVTAGQAVGHIVEPLEIALVLRGVVADSADLTRATLVLQGGQKHQVRVKGTRWTTAADQKRQMQIAVDNADGVLGSDGVGVLEVPAGRRPLLAVLWGGNAAEAAH